MVKLCGKNIRYSGTPLKYSFAEANDEKSVSVVEIGEKGGQVRVETVLLTPIRDMKKVRGTFEELMNPAYISKDVKADDYVQITLTDEDDVPNAMSRLQGVYKNALELRYDNARTRANASALNASVEEQKSAFALFEEFFELQNNAKMTDEQSEYMKDLIEKIEGESV